MSLDLRKLKRTDESVMRRMHAQFAQEDFAFLLAEGTWDQVLQTVENEARGLDLPAGRVQADFLVAEDNGLPVGRVSIRHTLNDYLYNFGGHIGYAVAPEYRNRGYATQILMLSLQHLAQLGIEYALVVCDVGNIASARVIEKCGGEFDDARTINDTVMLRYWVPTHGIDDL